MKNQLNRYLSKNWEVNVESAPDQGFALPSSLTDPLNVHIVLLFQSADG